MQVKLDKVFPVSAAAGWTFLQNIPGVASCMPGADITEAVSETHYQGKVKAKVGPATMAFNGDIHIESIDEAKKELHMIAKGQDSKGTSSVEMDLTAWIVDTGDGAFELKGDATVTVNGKAASLGGRLMTQIADQILNQFGKNFADNVIAMGANDEATVDEAAVEQAKGRLAEQPKELNGLAFVRSIFIGFFHNLFGKKTD